MRLKRRKKVRLFKVIVDDSVFAMQACTYTEAERKASELLSLLRLTPAAGFFLLEEV